MACPKRIQRVSNKYPTCVQYSDASLKFRIIVLRFCSIVDFIPVMELIFLVRISRCSSQSYTDMFPKYIDSYSFFLIYFLSFSNSFRDDHQGSVSTFALSKFINSLLMLFFIVPYFLLCQTINSHKSLSL